MKFIFQSQIKILNFFATVMGSWEAMENEVGDISDALMGSSIVNFWFPFIKSF